MNENNRRNKPKCIKELVKIPGVGKVIANGLWNIGITSIEELKDKNPENLYKKVCALKGEMIDKCVLYVHRCAVYYASNDIHDSELLKWWNWKDLEKN
jgi:predicted RecB family nuclease